MLRFKFRVILFYLISCSSDFTLTALEFFPNLRARFVLIYPLCPLLSLLASLSLVSPKVSRGAISGLIAPRETFGDTRVQSEKRITKGEAGITKGVASRKSFISPKMESEAGQKSYNHIDAFDEGQAPIIKLRDG